MTTNLPTTLEKRARELASLARHGFHKSRSNGFTPSLSAVEMKIGNAIRDAMLAERRRAEEEIRKAISRASEGITANYGDAYTHGAYDLLVRIDKELRSLSGEQGDGNE